MWFQKNRPKSLIRRKSAEPLPGKVPEEKNAQSTTSEGKSRSQVFTCSAAICWGGRSGNLIEQKKNNE